jgi:gamma-glutamyltranspeptidase/glutathione hydrolase
LHIHSIRRAVVIAALLTLPGCGLGHQVLGLGDDQQDSSLGQTSVAPTVFGYAVADEPQAALVARQILNQGGNAADAAAAAGFAMSVTLPSRAGLGGGGECLIKMPDAQGNAQPPVALIFQPQAPASAAGERPAAVPSLARGLLALQARFGVLPAASVIVPAERLAGGVPVSPALAADLQVVGSALLADPAAAEVFGANGGVLPAGANLVQPDLASTLEILRVQGVQGFYAGSFGPDFVAAANAAGGALTVQDLASVRPAFVPALSASAGAVTTAALAGPADEGVAAPATASFAALDKNGGVVVCAVTMDNLFGTGRIAAGTGVLLAASPRNAPAAPLAASMTYTTSGLTFRGASAGSGQGAVSPRNVIACPGGVPGGEATCRAQAGPLGLAIGGS